MVRINNEYYLSPKISKLLKKAGFDWERETCYIGKSGRPYKYHKFFNWNMPRKDFEKDGSDNLFHAFITQKKTNSFISAPTLDVAQRWLREVKKCYVSIIADCDSVGVFYNIRIIYYDANNNYHATYVWEETKREPVKHRAIFNNYEVAQEAGIKKALEIILKKGE